MTKRDFFIAGSVYAVLVALFVAAFGVAIASPDTLTYVMRFTTVHILFIGGLATLTVLFVVAVYVRLHVRAEWYQYLFYGGMLFSITGMLVAGLITGGENIRSILYYIDSTAAINDFYVSSQFGFEPYKNLVIYPAFINLFYAILGRFMASTIPLGIYGMRESHLGILVYTVYILLFYLILFVGIYKYLNTDKKEKILFIFCVIFSAPSLYLFDNGNSILLCLIFLLAFLSLYNSENKKRRYISYCFLGAAIATKITPIVFGLLVVNRCFKNNKRECLFAILICCGIFLIPFIFMDGGPYEMYLNIRNTRNILILFPHENELHLLGGGQLLNASSLFFILQRIFNIQLVHFGNGVVIFFCLLASIFVAFLKKWPVWKKVGILSAMLVVPVGFAIAYTSIYFILLALVIINEKPKKTILNIWYMILLLGILIPGVNVYTHFFQVFSEDVIPMQIMTFVEALSIFLIFITFVIDGSVSFYREYLIPRTPRVRCGALIGALAIVIIAGGWWWIAIHPIESFFPANMKAYGATRGFVMRDGLYYAMKGSSADVYLTGGKTFYAGMTVNFAPQEERSATETVSVYVDDKLATTHEVDNYRRRDFLYIPATWLRDNVNDDQLHVRIEREQDNSILPIDYIGYAQPIDGVPPMFYEYSSAGMVFYRSDKSYWTTRQTDFLLDEDRFTDGVLFSYDVPLELLNANEGRDIVATLSVNGKPVKQFPIKKAGQGDVYLNASDFSSDTLTEIKKNHTGILSIDCNADVSEKEQGNGADDRRRSLSIRFLGKAPDLRESNGKKLYGETKFFVNTEDLDDNGLAMVYSVPSLLFADGGGDDHAMEVSVDGTPVLQHVIRDKHVRSYYDAFVIPQEAFVGKHGIVELMVRQSGIRSDGNKDETDDSLPQICYLGPATKQSYISKDDGDIEKKHQETRTETHQTMWDNHIRIGTTNEEYLDVLNNIKFSVLASEYQFGLTFDKGQQLFYGTNCDFFLWNTFADTTGDFVMDYHIEPYLLMAAHGEPVTLALYLNDELIRRIPVMDDGDFTCIIPRGDLQTAAGKGDDFMHFRVVPSTKYNLYDMNIAKARELRSDRSIGIRFFGFSEKHENTAD